ncbi:MAG: T9SS C-terminal target domain-containing protein [Bacteroidetes bacterium]|nr:MAG: T9SS C-terminal target domain-containing protein [Bacteroidota bacterium]
MLDVNKDGLWEVTVPISADTIEYLFKVKSGGTFIQEQFLTVGTCTRTSGNAIYRYGILTSDSTFRMACFESCGQCAANLSLKGVTDFITPAGGSSGKAIYLIADSNISNLSIYGLGIANNGNGSNGQEYRFPNISVAKGSQILLTRDSAALATYMNTCWSNFTVVLIDTNGVVNQNGNDAVELFKVGEVIETFGDANQNGTGQPWEYTGSWAFKNNLGAWIYGGLNCTDSSATIFESDCIFPICNLIEVSSIQVAGEGNATAITQLGGALKMIATVLPTNAYNKNVTWSVNNAAIASINTDGILTAISNGTVVVKATAKDAGGVEGTASITISGQLVKVTAIVVNGEAGASTITQNGGTLKMLATVTPLDASNKEVNWSINDEDLATITNEGLLTALDNGTVIVKATAKDGSGAEGTASITITGQSNGLKNIQKTTINLFPNPIENMLYVQSDKVVSAYQIFSIQGKLITSGTVEYNQMDLSDLEAGVYILDLKINEGWIRQRVIKK